MYNVKISSITVMKAHGDVDARVHIYAATALERGRVAGLMLGRLYLRRTLPAFIL